MNAPGSINAQQRGSSPFNEPSIRPVPDRSPLHLVTTHGQVQIQKIMYIQISMSLIFNQEIHLMEYIT